MTPIENPIERYLGAHRLAVLTGFDHLLGFVECRCVDKNDVLLFGSGSKNSRDIGIGFYHRHVLC